MPPPKELDTSSAKNLNALFILAAAPGTGIGLDLALLEALAVTGGTGIGLEVTLLEASLLPLSERLLIEALLLPPAELPLLEAFLLLVAELGVTGFDRGRSLFVCCLLEAFLFPPRRFMMCKCK